MKNSMLILTFLLISLISSARNYDEINPPQSPILDELLQDSNVVNIILQNAVDYSAKYDDSYLRGIAPQVFGNENIFKQFMGTSDRTFFYLNFYNEIDDLDKYYNKYIKEFKYDSVDYKYYVDALNELIEDYTFYRKGKKIRHLRLIFKEGKEFYVWDDNIDKKFL